MTLHYMIMEGEHKAPPDKIDPEDFKTLLNCKDGEETAAVMAAHKWLRERYPHKLPRITLTVFHYTSDTPRLPCGKPLCLTGTVLRAHPEQFQTPHLN